MSQKNAKTDMLEHSQAKVALYSTYLSTWLNIMARTSSVSTVYIFDLFAGEGLYEDNKKGSAILACEAVKNHFYSSQDAELKVRIWFNDNEMSRFETDVRKVDRLKRIVQSLQIPANTDIEYFFEDYDDIWPRALAEVQQTNAAKGLFFLDPYGYKDIDPGDIRNIILAGDTEVILFVPISHMYRFAEASIKGEFPGGASLRMLLQKLFEDGLPEFSSVHDFIDQLKIRLRKFIGADSVFVDTFIIERDASNVYVLFFFTSHVRGFEKMLDAKWRLDRQSGEGFRREQSIQMFTDIELRCYPEKLHKYISESAHRTNHDLYQYGLEHGFLPKHTNYALKELFVDEQVERFSLDGKPNKGNYIRYRSPRTVGFRAL